MVGITPVLASSVDLRVSQLESEVRQLRSQVRQLTVQVGRLTNAPSSRIPSEPLEIPSDSLPSGSVLADDPMFDRLATLVIEQKRRLDEIESRLATLESQREE